MTCIYYIVLHVYCIMYISIVNRSLQQDMVAVTFTWATSECTMYPDGAALGDSNFDLTIITYVIESQICKSLVCVGGGGGGEAVVC